ncbi:hypothetical protein Tco_0414686 [Tanacetum coccineum]
MVMVFPKDSVTGNVISVGESGIVFMIGKWLCERVVRVRSSWKRMVLSCVEICVKTMAKENSLDHSCIIKLLLGDDEIHLAALPVAQAEWPNEFGHFGMIWPNVHLEEAFLKAHAPVEVVVRDAYTALYNAQLEVSCLMIASMTPELQKNFEDYNAFDISKGTKNYTNWSTLVFPCPKKLDNYGVTCEDEAKRRNSGAKTKTFEENCYLLPYTVSSKEDTAYQR